MDNSGTVHLYPASLRLLEELWPKLLYGRNVLKWQQGANKPRLRLLGGSLVLRPFVQTSVVPDLRGKVHPGPARAEHSWSLLLVSPGCPEPWCMSLFNAVAVVYSFPAINCRSETHCPLGSYQSSLAVKCSPSIGTVNSAIQISFYLYTVKIVNLLYSLGICGAVVLSIL